MGGENTTSDSREALSPSHAMPGSESLVTRMLPIIDNAATGEAIRARREAAKLSLRKVAEYMGWSAAYQSDLELGRRSWTDKKCLEVECAIIRLTIKSI